MYLGRPDKLSHLGRPGTVGLLTLVGLVAFNFGRPEIHSHLVGLLVFTLVGMLTLIGLLTFGRPDDPSYFGSPVGLLTCIGRSTVVLI